MSRTKAPRFGSTRERPRSRPVVSSAMVVLGVALATVARVATSTEAKIAIRRSYARASAIERIETASAPPKVLRRGNATAKNVPSPVASTSIARTTASRAVLRAILG